MKSILKTLPYFFIYTRLLSAPLNIYLAIQGWESGIWMGFLLIYCCLNDIFDGVIARFLGTDTVFMRRLDSIADVLYVISIYTSIKFLSLDDFAVIKPYFITLFGFEIVNYTFCLIKFKKAPSAHNYLSKFFGLFSAIVFTIYYFTGVMNFWIEFSFILGMIARTDIFIIYFILDKWTNDIPSAFHARLINKGIPFKRSKWFHSEAKPAKQ